jgi:hypothetical protein
MGYAKAEQKAHGIHMRLRARAFILSSEEEPINSILEEEPNILTNQRLRLGWSSLFHRGDEQKEKDEPTLSAHASRLDPEKTICFVSIDAGMVGVCCCRCRACLFSSPASSDSIFVFVWMPLCYYQGSDLVNIRVLERLEELLPQQAPSGKRLCHLENLSIR